MFQEAKNAGLEDAGLRGSLLGMLGLEAAASA